jgi:hypothetical protein
MGDMGYPTIIHSIILISLDAVNGNNDLYPTFRTLGCGFNIFTDIDLGKSMKII